MDELVDKTINNKCSKCGQCCGIFIPMTMPEIYKIKNYVKDNNIIPENRIVGNKIELRCPFLDLKNHKCKIYEVRPFVCRDFICNRKNWKKFRNLYMNRSKYNNYTVDELIYGDIEIHIRAMIEILKQKTNTDIKYEDLKIIFKLHGREDLLDKIKVEYEKG